MSRITEKGATGGMSLFKQAYSSLPANTPTTTPGTGDFNPDLSSCVGQKFDLSDGREVVLVSVGTSAIGSGLLCQASAQVTAFQGLAITVPVAQPATAGTFAILVTNGATVLNVNQFAGGYLVTASGTGLGQTLKISSHQPAANAGKFIVTLEDAILTTLDATTTVSLIANPYANVIVNPTTGTANPVGVTLYALAAATAGTFSGTTGAQTIAGVNQYGFIVSKGPTAVLQDADGATVGFPIGASDLTAQLV